MSPELAVQIVSYRSGDEVRSLLAGLRPELESSGVSHRVLVLENGTGEDLSDLPAEVHVSAENRGFGGGHNLLAGLSDTPLLLLVNPDVTIDGPVVAGLVSRFSDPAVVACGPLHRGADGAPQRWDHGELRGLRARVANGAGHAHWVPRSSVADVAWVSGAFAMFRRRTFPGFDERFFMYKEEEDACLQLRRAGGRVVYDPTVSVVHVGGDAGARAEHLRVSNARYIEKNFGLGQKLLEPLYLHVTRRI